MDERLDELHSLLYTAQRSVGQSRTRAITEARILLSKIRECPSQPGRIFHAVLPKNEKEGVMFIDERDARWTSTGRGRASGNFGVPTIGDNFREIYDEENKFKVIKVREVL